MPHYQIHPKGVSNLGHNYFRIFGIIDQVFNWGIIGNDSKIIYEITYQGLCDFLRIHKISTME
jgi:hypothetical protein